MAMYNYGVGGNETKVDANEAIQEIPENKSLIVSKLTSDAPFVPEVVKGLKTVEDVFRHFKPSVEVQHETQEGTEVEEEFRFQTLADFTPNSLIKNSEYLQQLNIEKDQYNKILRQLKKNKVLRKILEDKETKAALIDELKQIAGQLKK